MSVLFTVWGYDVTIIEFASVYNVRKILADKWNATQLSNQLDGAGIPIEFWQQSFSGMNAPSRQLETMVSQGKLRHQSDILTWMASNVSVRTNPDGYIRPVKPKVGSPERVDGIISLVMALGGWAAENEKPKAKPGIFLI